MHGRGSRFVAGLTAAVALLVAGAESTAGAPSGGRPQCTLVDGVMRVDPGFWQPDLRREGNRIVTTYARGTVDCGPTQPTVNNVDRIELLGDEFDLDFRGGAFAPGLTPEADGSSEIEIELRVGPLLGGDLSLRLGPGDDHVTLGSLGRSSLGANLNADEAAADVDLALVPADPQDLGRPRIELRGGRGDDGLDAGGGPGFVGPSQTKLTELRGGSGADRITGGDKTDILIGGAGHDRIEGGAGDDLIGTRDGKRDVVDCGRGRDILARDDRDRTKRCELERLPGEHSGDD